MAGLIGKIPVQGHCSECVKIINVDYTYIPGTGCRLAADDSYLQLTALLKIL
jgi:hypothetical protein